MSLPLPLVTLKLATSLDARIATRAGHSQWITGPEARAHVHRLRASHGAVLTGIGTVLADDPELTARTDPPPPRQPLRVVADSRGRMPLGSRMMTTLTAGAVVIATGAPARLHEHARAGADILAVPAGESGLDLTTMLQGLAGRFGVETLMVEAGSGLAGAFLRAGLVDRVEWFRAPLVIGADGLPALGGAGVDRLNEAVRWRRLATRACGADLWESYEIERV